VKVCELLTPAIEKQCTIHSFVTEDRAPYDLSVEMAIMDEVSDNTEFEFSVEVFDEYLPLSSPEALVGARHFFLPLHIVPHQHLQGINRAPPRGGIASSAERLIGMLVEEAQKGNISLASSYTARPLQVHEAQALARFYNEQLGNESRRLFSYLLDSDGRANLQTCYKIAQGPSPVRSKSACPHLFFRMASCMPEQLQYKT